MKKEEAIKIITDKYPNHIVDEINENNKYFLISIISKKYKDFAIKPLICDDGLKAVEKNTGKVFTYNPVLHS